MRRISYRPFVILIFTLIFIMSLPLRLTENARLSCMRALHISWQGLSLSTQHNREEIESLQLENHSLRTQIHNIREWLLFEDRLEEQLARFHQISSSHLDETHWRQFFQRRCIYLADLIDKQYQSLPAKVIFREPAAWNTCLWVNVGEKDNAAVGLPIIAKNSPVLVGSSVIGIVEFVGPHQSRVRLITDASLSPAVRAVRGHENERLLLEHIDALILGLEIRSDGENEDELLQSLYHLQQRFNSQIGDRYLAKGELRGNSHPLWRSRNQVLKGIGFNYDFADEEGCARNLRSPDPLLQVGDLLVTSGLDGIFPPDLPIAIVTKIFPLREGACSYELEARAIAGDIDELTCLHILPPIQH